MHGDEGIAEDLLAIPGIDVNGKNSRGQTPLMMTVTSKSVHIARNLLDRGALLGLQDEKGNTAMDYAFQAGSCELVKLFHARGAQLIRMKKGKNIHLEQAKRSGNDELLAYFAVQGIESSLHNSYHERS